MNRIKIQDNIVRLEEQKAEIDRKISRLEALKEVDKLHLACIKKIEDVLEAFKSLDVDKLTKLHDDSPAGDGYGCDNYVVAFNDILSQLCETGDPIDIVFAASVIKEAKEEYNE
jgi:hypothetical protein